MNSTALDAHPGGGGTATLPSQRVIRIGSASLIAGGLIAMIIHVLYGIGHGRTVFNENKEVLGLTNDTWSRVGVIGTALLVVGLAVLRRTDPSGPMMRRATTVLVVGLILRATADWVFNLYVPAELLLLGGRAMLVAATITAATLPRWSAVPLIVTVGGWVLFAAVNDAVYDASTEFAGYTVAGNDVLAFVTALSWVSLGVGMQCGRTTVRTPVRFRQPAGLRVTGEGSAITRHRSGESA